MENKKVKKDGSTKIIPFRVLVTLCKKPKLSGIIPTKKSPFPL